MNYPMTSGVVNCSCCIRWLETKYLLASSTFVDSFDFELRVSLWAFVCAFAVLLSDPDEICDVTSSWFLGVAVVVGNFQIL